MGKNTSTDLYSMCRHFALAKAVKSKHAKGNCWEHGRADAGYAHKPLKDNRYFKTKSTMLHRYIYAVYYDTPLDKDTWIGHKCHNKRCINPHHLEITTPKDNCWRNYPEVYNQNNKDAE